MYSQPDIRYRRLHRGTNVGFVLILLAAGCAPADFADGVPWAIRRSHTSNARARFVRKRPSLRFNTFLLDELRHVETAETESEARELLLHTIDESHNLAVEVYDNELDRLSNEETRKLLDRYFSRLDRHAEPRTALQARFIRVAQARYAGYRRRIASMVGIRDIQHEAQSLRRAALSSPKDHRGGRIATGLVASFIKENREPLDRGGPEFDLYAPAGASFVRVASAGRRTSPGASPWLSRYAPIILQERVKHTNYPPDTDVIGTVRLENQGTPPRVVVDTAAPSVYAYESETLIGGKRRTQLIYTYWFPRHPALKHGDTQAGEIEGATLRITLDGGGRPILFETVLNCGCFHRCYPSAALEAAACKAYGAPLKGKRFCVERKEFGRIDWIVPETVDVPAGAYSRPVLFSRAGYHGPAGVTFDRRDLAERTMLTERGYDLRRYDELEHLPTGGGFASMFLDNGLVRGAERLEGTLLSPTGMLRAGQPRQRGTQLLHWDQYDFDDPHLLETSLRMPPGF